MSVQFGKCNFDGKPVDPQDLDEVRPVLAPYGPDGEGYICKDNFGLLYRAFYTTKESRCDIQPHVFASEAVLVWDGRLDNREELIGLLACETSATSTDLEIVAAAYEHWGTGSFARLIGDWALSIWDPRGRRLILARDFIGTRQLYYSVEKDHVKWCTILDPLVLFAGHSFKLHKEYVAGWLAFFPAPQITPYVGIDSVPPSSFVRLEPGGRTIVKYWDFDPGKRVRYRADAEYEESFRDVISSSVRRRLRSDTPVLAELSGGMDSSSIVCVADIIIAQGAADTPRLDTVSYYNDSEPNWNERPFFTKVEEKRGRTGCHIDVSKAECCGFEPDMQTFTVIPGSGGGPATVSDQRLADYVKSQGSRVVLSGTGGDEVTGGVPTPIPELMDLLVTARFKTLASELRLWALNQRKPWFHLLFETAQTFAPPFLVGVPKYMRPAPWLDASFVKRNRAALTGYPARVKLLGPLPNFQENICALEMLRRQLSCSALSLNPPREKRYPYLDRDLLEFMYAIPREQVVRPGQRRSLMRRALTGIVPDDVLKRKRKAFVARSTIVALSGHWEKLAQMGRQMVLTSWGVVDPKAFSQVLEIVRYDKEIPTLQLMRTLGVEIWLKALARQGVLSGIS
jgi:asparagine synthase (glutamine-hydrolysing)